jgi:hypothetical protein
MRDSEFFVDPHKVDFELGGQPGRTPPSWGGHRPPPAAFHPRSASRCFDDEERWFPTRRVDESSVPRGVIDRLARAGRILQPAAATPGHDAVRISTVVLEIERATTALLQVLRDGQRITGEDAADLTRGLRRCATRIRAEWAERLTDRPPSELDPLIRACHLVTDAIIRLQPGAVS